MEEREPELEVFCEPDISEQPTEAPEEDTLTRISRELEELRALVNGRETKAEEMASLAEFRELYPDTAVEDIPDAVWESVHGGVPLAAAYALWMRREALRRTSAEAVNRKNAGGAWGRAGSAAAGEYLSPDEVRGMSKDEVRQNYARIMESMKHWN